MDLRNPDEFQGAPWDRITLEDLAEAARVPTMLAPGEQRLYYWLTRHWARGDGAVVDLGCFAGGSTARLAAGQKAAGVSTPILAYDRFTADAHAKEKFLYPAGIAPFNGHDILPLAQDLLAPWADRVSLVPGEIHEIGWVGDPIEILIVDAAKNVFTMDDFAQAFFPSLIPGRSLIVQQDILFWQQPWIAAQMERMAPWVEPVAMAPDDTVVFLVKEQIGPEALTAGRCARLSDRDLLKGVQGMRDRLRPMGLAARLRPAIKALRANPGVRYAYDMKWAGG